MRSVTLPAVVSLALVSAIVSARQAPPPQAKSDPAAILAAARAALGGDNKIAAVKTFIATGRTRQVRGDNLVPIEFEIQSELPDRYSRRDEIPAQDTGPTTTGFNGERLVLIPPPPAPLPDPARAGRVATVKQDFARLMLGMFASSFKSYPLTFTYLAQAEAPQGKADVLEVKGPGNFTARLFINAQTPHVPLMVSWEGGGPPGPGRGLPPGFPQGPPPGLAQGTTQISPQGQPQGSPQSPAEAPPKGPPVRGPIAPIENRLYFADYREVDGLQLPFRLRRAVGADTTEETTFDRFRINARVDPRRFEAGN
jgi:hypothetical protein